MYKIDVCFRQKALTNTIIQKVSLDMCHIKFLQWRFYKGNRFSLKQKSHVFNCKTLEICKKHYSQLLLFVHKTMKCNVQAKVAFEVQIINMHILSTVPQQVNLPSSAN